MATSFNSSGSTPSFGFSSPAPISPIGIGSTPVATALNNSQNSIIPKAPPPPTQSVASQTHTDTAGNSVKTTYAPPDTSSFTPAQLTAYNNALALVPTTSGMIQSNPSSQNTVSTAGNAVIPVPPPGTPPPQSVSGPSPQPTASSVPNTYPGILSAATSASNNAATQGSAAYGNDNTAMQQYQAQLSGLMNQQSQENANINASPQQIDFKQGQEAGLQALFTGQENAASTGLQSEATAANTAANVQGQGISGLNTAANQSMQTVTPPAGGVSTNPLTGQQYSNPIYEPSTGAYQALSPQPGGTTGQPSTAGQATQYTIKSGDTLNAIAAQYGIPESTLAAANPNAVPTNLRIGGTLTIPSASGSNSPFTGGVAAGNAALGQQYAQNVSANIQAQTIKGNIESYLQSNPTLNPSAFTQFNSALQLLNGQVSNPQYQTLSNYLQEYVNTLAPILGVGGDTTNLKTQIANGFVNAAASGQSIASVLDGIETLANAKVASQAGGTAGQIQSPTYSGAAGAGTGSVVPSGGGWASLGDTSQ